MYISKIWLENIRGFRSGELRVDLDLRRPDGRYAGWTVLAGRNGAGKSTFLKALALAASGSAAARTLQQSFSGWIREGEEHAYAGAELFYDRNEDGFERRGKPPASPFWVGLTWSRSEAGPEPSLAPGVGYTKAAERGPWADNPIGWFLAGYGPYRRLAGHASDAQRLMVGAPRIARLVSLFREDASLVESIQWLKEFHLRRLEQRQGADELLEGVLDLLNHGLLPDSARVARFDSEGLWVTQGGITLPIRDLSDGYRTMAALVMDLARQLHGAYHDFKLIYEDGRCYAPYQGVVLIDEVELHLHVSWQRRIGFWLKEHFPNIQFIVTTHSPFVCQAADPKGLIRLPAPGENRAVEHVSDELYKTVVNGTVDEAALTELFGLEHVHSDQSEALREQVARLEARILRGEATPEERGQLEQLASQLPDTASTLMERALRKYGLDK